MIFNNLFNKNADQLAKEAIADYQKGKDEFKVIEKLQKALKIGIKHYPLDQIYLHIGASYFDLAIYDKAKDAYEKGLEYNSKNHSLLSNLGLTHNKLGNIENSIPYYKASLEIKPDNSYAYHNIGLYLYENGEHFEAIQNLDKAIQFNPGLNVSYAVKSRCLAFIGKYKEAEKALKDAVNKGYDNAKVLKTDLENIKYNNPLIFSDLKKFNELLSCMQIDKGLQSKLIEAQKNSFEFYTNNTSLFENSQLTSFEINCALHWHLLISSLRNNGKILSIDETSDNAEILTKIKNLLLATGFEINDLLDEFENSIEYDSEELLFSIASKLKLSCSIELLNIWTSDEMLNLYPIDKQEWESLKYPFIDTENGFGKITPIATTQRIEDYLTNEL